MGPRRPRPVVLDAGALIAFEKNDRKVRTLVELALAHGAPLWTRRAESSRRCGATGVARLVSHGSSGPDLVRVQPLDREEAQATGAICGETGTRDVVDASVVLLARKHGAAIVTSDPEDLKRVDPSAQLVVC